MICSVDLLIISLYIKHNKNILKVNDELMDYSSIFGEIIKNRIDIYKHAPLYCQLYLQNLYKKNPHFFNIFLQSIDVEKSDEKYYKNNVKLNSNISNYRI